MLLAQPMPRRYRNHRWTGRHRPGSTRGGGKSPPLFIQRGRIVDGLSIFIDVCGDFGSQSETYLFTLVLPSQYLLFQRADLFFTIELMRFKLESGRGMTRPEEVFFESRRKLMKNYLKTIDRVRL